MRVFLLLLTVYCYYYLSANYLIPIRKGWIRKTKNHQQEPEENERSKNNEQRATAIGLEKQTMESDSPC